MSEGHNPSTSAAKELPSILEAVVGIRFLLLLLCLLFYLDVWLIENNVNPLSLSLKDAYAALLSARIFSVLLFIGSYSLLMAGFFPALRGLVGLLRMHVQSEVYLSSNSAEVRRLSDWAMAFVCLSAYSGILGYFSASEYTGLVFYILNFLSADGIAEVFFRLCVFFFWLYCFTLASNVDDPNSN